MALHHASFFPRPHGVRGLAPGGRRICAFRAELDRIEARARARAGAPNDEVERNRRLVRAWDGISHDLLVNALPRVRHAVPAREGTVDVTVSRRDGHTVVDPWPFRTPAVEVTTRGRLLRGRFADEPAMRRALAEAPIVPLRFELRPA